jgi:FkbM family methyltransferase
MLQIEEHTIEEKILNKNGWVLDLGCVNFKFSEHMLTYCDNVISIDANPNIVNTNDRIIYKNYAVVDSDKEMFIDYHIFNDKQGNSLLKPEKDWCVHEKTIKIPTTTIHSLMIEYDINQFDLIKIDIEGSEYKLLENMDWTISKQYSVEFHDFRNMNPYYPNNELYYQKIFDDMLKYCDIIKHDRTDHPGFPLGQGSNYWDSLFILKKEYYKK